MGDVPPKPYSPPVAGTHRRLDRFRTARVFLWAVAIVVWLCVIAGMAILWSTARLFNSLE